MSKYLWFLVILFTLVLIKVVNTPAESFALDPNFPDPNIKQIQDTEHHNIAEPNEIEAKTETSSVSDVNDKQINPTATPQSIEEPEDTEEPKDTEKEANPLGPSEIQKEIHEEFANIFADYINVHGKVDFARLRRQRVFLRPATSILETLKPDEYEKWSKEDKIAFWINTYNLHKLKAIIENYPIEGSRWLNPIWGANSIRHIKNQIDVYKFIVMNEEFTFDEIKQRIFKDKFKEPKVYFAITMGTKSSPKLLNAPYQGEKLHEQLDEQIRRFLADQNIGFRADENNGVVYLPLMLKDSWYGKQFTERYYTDKLFKDQSTPEIRSVLNFIINYIPSDKVSFLKTGNYSVKYLNYSWLIDE